MKKLFYLAMFVALLCTQAATANTYNVNATQSTSAIQSVVAGASASDSVIFAAGTYNITAGLTLTCGVTYSGPAVSPPTAILNATYTRESASIFTLTYGSGFAAPCTQNTTIEYFNFENEGGILVKPSYTNLTIQFNQFTNIPCCQNNNDADSAISFNGSGASGSSTQNLTNTLIQWNTIGDSTSCTTGNSSDPVNNGMNYTGTTSGSTLVDNYGGSCGGISVNTTIGFGQSGTGSSYGLTVQDNLFNHVGEGIHFGCPQPPYNPSTNTHGMCEPNSTTAGSYGSVAGSAVTTQYVKLYNNDFNQMHRMAFEEQPQITGGVDIQNNSIHDWYNPYFGSFGMSFACCDGLGANIPYSPFLNVQNNLIMFNITSNPSAYGGLGSPQVGYMVEAWGWSALYTNNLWQTNTQGSGGTSTTWGFGGGTWSISNNTFCGPAFGTSFITNEFGQPTPPTQTGNSTTSSVCTQVASVAPVISPNGGLTSYPVTVTLTDNGYTSGALPQGNHSIWYTIDGSTPVPGSGTAIQIANGGTFSLTGAATVNAVGMWGTGAQPSFYTTGYGFKPSTTTSAHFTSANICTVLASGGSIASAAASCGSGNTIQLASGGTYTIASQINWPCGVSMVGPTVPYSQTPNQLAHITGTLGANNTAISTTANCSAPSTIAYVEWNGGRYNPGGQFIYINPGTNGFTITNNNIHGNNCGVYCGSTAANLITVYGANPGQTGCCNASGAVTKNITITWNLFGAVGDCATANVYSTNSNTASGGGYCNGVGSGGNLQNIIINNNRFTDGDNEVKYYEAATNSSVPSGTSGYANPYIIDYNDFERYNRIAYEGQINWGGPNEPTLQYVQYNSFTNMLNPRQQNYDISAANGCIFGYNTTGMTNCETHVDYNISVQNISASQSSCGGDPGFEFWSGQNSTMNGNFWVGGFFCHSINFAPSGNFTANNNLAWIGGSAALCSINKIGPEDSPAFNPTCSGNQSTAGPGGTVTSVTPVLTVNGGSITITNTNVSTPNGSNPGRDSNTTMWCTGDGTTPVAGSSNSTPYWVGAASQTVATGVVPSSGTLRCIGMWGAPNQPYSYPSGYGYVPSAIVTASVSSSPTTATPVFSPASTSFSASITVSVSDATAGATIYCTTNGTAPTTASTVYTGPVVFTATVSPNCMATAAGNNNSAIGTATYTLTPAGTVATPVLSPTSQSFTGTLVVTINDATPGASIFYTTNGTTPTIASTAYTTPVSLTATTTINVIATAPALTQSAVGTGTYSLGSAPTLTGGFQGNSGATLLGSCSSSGINTMVVGQAAIQQAACGQYSDSVIRTLPDAFGNTPVWSSTDPTKLTVSPTGLVQCIATTTALVYSKVQSSPTSPNPNVLLNSWGWTCNAASLQGITIACAQTSFSKGQQGPCTALCVYNSGGFDCTQKDINGNQATWTSTVTAIGIITSPGGEYWSAGSGATVISAAVGALTSSPITISNLTSGLYGRPMGHNTPWVGFGK